MPPPTRQKYSLQKLSAALAVMFPPGRPQPIDCGMSRRPYLHGSTSSKQPPPRQPPTPARSARARGCARRPASPHRTRTAPQPLAKAGLYFAKPCFLHGQLYFALSRVGSPQHVRVLVEGAAQPANQGGARAARGRGGGGAARACGAAPNARDAPPLPPPPKCTQPMWFHRGFHTSPLRVSSSFRCTPHGIKP
ncbi:MAG: hypothetical protein J3K34DRAFT_2768 [Monoraphidium minutum]|nr:MAG: hypothetical protein J3K34DRAFT_2768 [Monoraphidium minutum]